MQALVPPASELLVAALMLGVLWVRAGVPGELPVVLTFLALLYRLQPQVQQLDGARVSLAAAAAPTAAVMELLATPDPTRAGTRTIEGVVERDPFRRRDVRLRRPRSGRARRARRSGSAPA